MPGHWGRSSSSSSSKGSAAPGGTGGGGWSPGVGGQQHQPKAKTKTVTTGGQSPFAYTKPPKKKTSTWTPGAGKPTHIPKKKTTVKTRGGGGGGPSVTKTLTLPFAKARGVTKKKKSLLRDRNWMTASLQGVSNMPKYWELPSGIRTLIEAGEDIPFAHGFSSKAALENAKKYGFQTSRFKKVPTTSEIEKAIRTKDLSALKKAEGVFGATGSKMSDALKSAAQYAKGPFTRGVGKAGPTSHVLRGMVNPMLGYVDRGMLGNVQVRLPSGVVNKALDLGPPSMQRVSSGTGLDHLTRGGKDLLTKTGKVKDLAVVDALSKSGKLQSGVLFPKVITQSATNKLLARALPGANIALGGASALGHIQAGNYGQAAMAGLSMAPGPLGWAGLGGEVALGALQKNPIPDYTGIQGLESGMQIGRNYNRGGIARLYG